MKKEHKYLLLFIFCLLFVSWLFDYHHILFLKPQSSHMWRQSDCASFALNYYQGGMNFFKPKVHHVLGGEGYSVSEFPIWYYLTAWLYKIFGPSEFWFRLLILTIFFSGLVAIYFLTFEFIGTIFWSFVIPLLLFSSPVLSFYANNFLPNIPALSFEFVALLFFFKFYNSGKKYWLILFFIAYLICGFSKISSMIGFTALLFIFLMNVFLKGKLGRVKSFNTYNFFFGIGFLMVGLIIWKWYFYAQHFNQEYHSSGYLLVGILPLWKMSFADIRHTFDMIFNFWWKYYYFSGTVWLLVIMTIIIFFSRKKIDAFLWLMTVLVFIGCVMYCILWFGALANHDYYVINLYIYVLFLFLASLSFLKNRFLNIYNSRFFKIAVSLFVLVNLIHAKNMMGNRYHGSLYDRVNVNFYDDRFKPYIHSLGIQSYDKVISVPDKSPNNTLYLMNQPGWSIYSSSNGECYTSEELKFLLSQGAKYLVLNDTNYVKKCPNISLLMKSPIGNYNSIYVYDLRNIDVPQFP